MCVLESKGFDYFNNDHILITCGSILSGINAVNEFGSFFIDLSLENRIIIIKNDFDESIIDTIEELCDDNSELNIAIKEAEESNWDIMVDSYKDTLNQCGTLDYIANLLDCSLDILWKYRKDLLPKLLTAPLMETIKDSSVFYYEMGQYVFVHGWIPTDYGPRKGHQFKKTGANPRHLIGIKH